MSKIDIKGQKFGRLLVLEKAKKPEGIKGREIYWKCLCDCGNIKIVRGVDLRSGHTKSCGCIQKEKTSVMRKRDLSNQRFGHLIALYPNGLDSNKHYLWHCKCDCGKECDVNVSNLTGGLVKSCGCEWHSSTEIINIKNLLNSINIPYQTEFKININNRRFYFDIFVNNKYFIEYDGEQHFKYKVTGWNNKKNFEITRERDLLKNKYCFDNNIPLIRIPYNAKYQIEDLIPITTKFLLTKENEKIYYRQESEGDK